MSWEPSTLAPLGPRGARLAYAVDAAVQAGEPGEAALALSEAGDALANMGLARPTRLTFEAALGFAVEAGARRLEAELAWRLGQVAEATGEIAQAATWYERAAACFGADDAAADQVVALQAEARCRYRLEGPTSVERLLREAIVVARAIGDDATLAAVMEQAAESSQAVSDIDAAAARYQEAARLYASAGDEAGLVRATIGVAECELERGEHVKAIHTIAPIEAQLELGQDEATRGRGLALLARFYLQAGERSQALEQLEGALELLARAGADDQRAHLLMAFARVLEDEGRAAAAEPLYAEALTLYDELGDTPRVGPAAYSLARCLLEQHELPRADAAIDRALEVCQRLGDLEGLDVCTRLAVKIAVRMGQVGLALDRFRLAARVKAELGDFRGEVRYLLGALGATLLVPEDFDSVALADEFIEALRRTGTAFLGPEEVYEVAEKLDAAGRPDYAREIMTLQAQVGLDEARLAKAAQAFAQAATYAVNAGEAETARALWDQAITIGEEQGLAEVRQWRINRDLFAQP